MVFLAALSNSMFGPFVATAAVSFCVMVNVSQCKAGSFVGLLSSSVSVDSCLVNINQNDIVTEHCDN